MSNVIDLTAARQRLQEKAVVLAEFDFAAEIEWAEAELDATSDELDELSNQLEELTNYMVEITTYLGGLATANSLLATDSPEQFIKQWLNFKTEVIKQSEKSEVVFTPEFDKE